MVKNLLTIVLMLGFIFGLSSCGNDDDKVPAPAPQAGFTKNRWVIERLETVTFTNTSQNAIRFEWDFGNGKLSTDANPVITFSDPGHFIVTLTAYNQDNVAEMFKDTVIVGYERYLKEVRIINFSFTDPSGQPWDSDDGTGPDIRLRFGPETTFQIGTPEYENLTPADLPLINSYWNQVGRIPLGNSLMDQIWTFKMEEYGLSRNRTLKEWTLNPSKSGTKSYTDGSGVIILTDNQHQIKVEVHFQIQ